MHRRDFLRLGAVSGLALPGLLRAAPSSFGRARRCVLLFLTGGPPQHDTWDPKPDAPVEYRGEFRPIATSVPGVHFGELFPKTAAQARHLCVVRSVTHADRVHTSAGYSMLTGMLHPLADTKTATDIRPGPHDHPHLGSLLALTRPSSRGLPVFASLPEAIKDANVNPFPGLDGGFLGKRYAPWRIDGTPTGFRVPDVALPDDVSVARLARRRELVGPLDRGLPSPEADHYQRQAFALLRTPELRTAFALEREPDRVRAAYGPHLFGQGCLLARRLLEAGLALVSVYWHYEGPDDSPVWDTHENNFRHLRERLGPPTDQAVAALVADLHQRGMLDDTLVIVMGEFGRTPRVNKKAGRDHWPAVQSLLLAGAGVPGGSVYGSSDRLGAYPGTTPVTPADLFATFLHLLGIAPDLIVHDATGRPYRACAGKAVADLCS